MSWRYRQKHGALSRVDRDGTEVVVGHGYSGRNEGLNNPDMQDVPNVGPIPRGRWTIGAPYDSERIGPFALPLLPDPDTETFGRSAFRIHGDRRLGPPKSASHGCVILSRDLRELIWDSSDTDFEVVE